jgi:hypothetical protein
MSATAMGLIEAVCERESECEREEEAHISARERAVLRGASADTSHP